ncbi:alanine racemase [Thalassotalea sp. PLHSN55]|uniref:alanine racemase n=1 Tax=Thalassotalea sp. PLHSN55 TaxID=3435888 RepID=UPI003F87ECA0
MSLRTATALIDRQALANNFNVVKALAPTANILAVLKANAYGHGLELIAKTLIEQNSQADAFGVARLDEALALRSTGVVKPIVLLEGFFDAKDISKLAEHNLQTIVHNHEQLEAITDDNLSLAEPLKVWLKIDTGMHRLGINPEDFDIFYQKLSQSKNVHADLILMSHMACADEKNNQATTQQIAIFEKLTANYQEQKSMANSAGCFAWPESHYQWLRPGLMLYGVSPMISTQDSANEIGIEPVMTLQSSLIALRKIPAGEAVGYGGAWVSDKETIIGVIAIGYGDGYPRHAGNGTPVLINGRKVPLVGRVAMDMITVDLGINAQENIGDIATLWGKGLPVEEIAEHADTIPYELLCNITRRVQVDVL